MRTIETMAQMILTAMTAPQTTAMPATPRSEALTMVRIAPMISEVTATSRQSLPAVATERGPFQLARLCCRRWSTCSSISR